MNATGGVIDKTRNAITFVDYLVSPGTTAEFENVGKRTSEFYQEAQGNQHQNVININVMEPHDTP